MDSQSASGVIDQAPCLVSEDELRLHEYLFAPVNGRPVSLEQLASRCEQIAGQR